MEYLTILVVYMSKGENIILNLYCDEIKECPLKIPHTNTFEKWTYIEFLLYLNTYQIAYSDSNGLRCLSQPPPNHGIVIQIAVPTMI